MPRLPDSILDADPQTGCDVLVDEPGNGYRFGRKGIAIASAEKRPTTLAGGGLNRTSILNPYFLI
jgi:hypothetical protein